MDRREFLKGATFGAAALAIGSSTNALFAGTPAPQPATYLLEPMLSAKGRAERKKGLESILRELPALASKCDDGGRIENIERSITVTLTTLNTIAHALHDPA